MSDAYRGLSADIVVLVGKVTIGGTMVEDLVYQVAEALGLEPRRWQAKETARHIREALRERGVPPWARTSVGEIDEWLTGVLDVLDRRGAIVHRAYFARAVDGGMVQHGQRTNRVEDARPVSAAQMTATLAELERVSSVGTELFHSLLPKLAHGVFEYYYGPDAGKLIVTYVDGAWPPRPTDEDRARWHSELNRQYPGYFEDSLPPEEEAK